MTSLRKNLSSGIFYTALARYSGVFISIGIGAVLARLLSPSEFGIVALVTVFVSFFGLLSDFGLGPAVVQNQNLDDKDVESIFTVSILFGLILAGVFYLAAPVIAKFYGEPELVLVSRLLSLAVLFNSFMIIPKALFRKALQFKLLGLITVALQLICGIVAIILAYFGYSYYSLVVQSILLSSISLVIYYWLKPVKIAWKINFDAIRKVFKFSIFQFLFNFINYFSRNADNLLIGKFMGLSPLGFYDKAYRLMLMPVSNLTHVISPVLMPVLSKHQNNKAFVFDAYVKVVRLLALVGFPLSAFLYFSAYEIINILFGQQWDASIPVFKVLSLTIGVQIILSSSGSIFQTLNRTDLLFFSGLLSSVTMISGIAYGIFIGQSLESVGWGLFGAFCINFFQAFYLLIGKSLNASFVKFFGVLVYPICIALTISIVLLVIESYNFHGFWTSLVLKSALSGLLFILLVGIRKEYRLTLTREFDKLRNRTKIPN